MAGLILIYLKEKVTPKSLHFLSCPTDISASEVPAILKKFASKEATSETTILKLIGSQAVFMWRHSVRLEIGERRKIWNWLVILHKVCDIYFFRAIIHCTIFNVIISEFGACLPKKKYGSRAAIAQSDS